MNCRVLRVVIVAAVLLLGLCLGGVLALHPFMRNRLEKGEGTFRVMTLNVNVMTGDGETPFSADRLCEVIKLVDPNVLCVQEMASAQFESFKEMLDSSFRYCESVDKSMIVFSDYPTSKPERYKCVGQIDSTDFSDSYFDELKIVRRAMPVFSVDLTMLDGQTVTVYNCHLRSGGYSSVRRSMGEEKTWLSGLPKYWREYRLGRRIRDYEADNIRNVLDTLRTGSMGVVMAGDFNDFSGSYCLRRICRNRDLEGSIRLSDAWLKRGNGFGFTYDGWHLRLRLDHILYTPSTLRLRNVQVLDTDLSDHRILIADFEVKE